MISGSAVARTWGDKVLVWLERSASDSFLLVLLKPVDWVNIPASLVSAACTGLLLAGVRESKLVTNLITAVKMLVVGLMVIGGFLLFYPGNMQPPFAPFGINGVLRGATSSFFGYVCDEVVISEFWRAYLDGKLMLYLILCSWGTMKSALLLERQSTPSATYRVRLWEL